MTMKNVKVTSNHGMERIEIRATSSQKALVKELRENKKLYIEENNGEYSLIEKNKGRLKVLNGPTVSKLIKQGVLEFVDPLSTKINLSVLAR